MIQTMIKSNNYMDSVFLMKTGKAVGALDGVKKAVAVMGTDLNKTVLREFGALNAETEAAGTNDLIVAVDADEDVMAAVEECLAGLLNAKKPASGSTAQQYVSVEQAAAADPELNLAVISLPGDFAAYEGIKALKAGMHVFMFSDNVPLEDELEMKRIGREKGLLVMGPGAGTAIIDNISIGLMSKVRRKHIGIVAASGSGLQEVAMLVHNWGEGISQAIGTGGSDLSKEVGGSTMLMGMDILKNDPDTDVIVLISKPPHPDTMAKMFAAVKTMGKPVVIFFLGGKASDVEASGAYCAKTLEEAASMAVALARGETPEKGDYVASVCEELLPLAKAEAAKLTGGQKYLRGLFCGGTHSEEAVMLLQEMISDLYSNINFGHVTMMENRHVSTKNCLVDMGDEEFTVGKPHPVMDPSILNDRLVQEGSDPDTAILLFDLLLGYGVHEDPAGTIADSLRQIREKTEAEGRHICMIASICGTDLDPQDYQKQKKTLEDLGVIVLESNGRAALFSGLIAKEVQK